MKQFWRLSGLRIHTLCKVLIGICLVSGCTKPERREEFLSNRDERNVVIQSPRFTENTVPVPRLIYLYDIDCTEFPFEPPIWHIEDLTSDASGTIYIADRGHAHVVMTDIQGRYIGSIGQKGPGPFEFTDANPIYGMQVRWIDDPGILAAYDFRRKILLFQKDGSYLTERITEDIQKIRHIAAIPSGIVTHLREDPPFVLFNLKGNRIRSLGRFLEPDDTPWRALARCVARSKISEYPGGGIRVDNIRRPHLIAVASDTLLIHDLHISNGYRAWNLNTGDVEWQLNLEILDYEPPTLVKYSTSSTGAFSSWSRFAPPHVYERSWVMSIHYLHPYIYAAVSLRGDGTRSKPDRKVVMNPSTESEELGAQEWSTRGVLEVISQEPDLIAHLTFDAPAVFSATIVPGPYLVLAFNEPSPYLSIFRIEGLPDSQ